MVGFLVLRSSDSGDLVLFTLVLSETPGFRLAPCSAKADIAGGRASSALAPTDVDCGKAGAYLATITLRTVLFLPLADAAENGKFMATLLTNQVIARHSLNPS